jgi:hypothetical protein
MKLIVKLKYELFGSLTPRSQEKMKESEAKPRGNPISLETLLGIDRRWAEEAEGVITDLRSHLQKQKRYCIRLAS